MSYARFGGESDVYVYEHFAGFIQCCGCSMVDPEDDEIFAFFEAKTAREMLSHLDSHRGRGDAVPNYCYDRIKEEYEDLDGKILPFEDQKRLGKVTE